MRKNATPETMDPIVKEAQERFKRCEGWESHTRELNLADLKFDAADADNGYQWPNELRKARDVDERPCLTINKTHQHCLQIINDAKQNKPEVRISPVGDGAHYKAALAMQGLVRHIEAESRASIAYDTATEFQVKAGIGYWRVLTDYAGDDTFDQEIRIAPINDPFSVYLDPNIKHRDGSDAKFGFIFTDVPLEEFEDQWPEYKDAVPRDALGLEPAGSWFGGEFVRVCEYYRKVETKDQLISFVGADGQRQNVLKGDLPAEVAKEVLAGPDVLTREVTREAVEWYLIIGDERKEKREWPGKYIPIVRLPGEETLLDGVYDRKGHVRALKDPQRMYNYWSSSAVEHVALQGKTPWVAPAEAIEGYETYWESANRVNHAVLPYNAINDQGLPVQPPTRQEPPMMAPAYLQGMQTAAMEMMMVSGQYQAEMGQQGNERSGKAINERQRQGDNATYHFVDNLAMAIRFTGVLLIDLIPKIYDTRRVLQILGEDGTNIQLTIDPEAKQALQMRAGQDGQIMEMIFNPGLGRYAVQADIGPAYGTKRQQAFDAFVTLITQAPGLTSVIGDIMLRAADFPMADEAAERIKRTLPPAVLGQGPSQQEQALTQQVQALQGMLDAAAQELAEAKAKLKGKEQLRDVDAFNAETKRLDVLAKAGAMGQGDMQEFVRQLVEESIATQLQHIFASNAKGGEEAEETQAKLEAEERGLGEAETQPDMTQAKQAQDGHWYVPHPAMPGKWLKVEQEAGEGGHGGLEA